MELVSKRVYETLVSKGVDHVFHANSVITACQFLRRRSLLSRGTVARRGLYQTPQSSDPTDKAYGIWFDIFVDSVDIHDRASRANSYGPVLFVLNSELIKKSYGKIWVTKLNPTKWEGLKPSQAWFQSTKELNSDFVRGDFDQMIVFRHCGGELPIKKFLTELIVDDPDLETKGSHVDYYSMAFGALKLAMTEGAIDVPIKKRKCSESCKCGHQYQNDLSRAKLMYVPAV